MSRRSGSLQRVTTLWATGRFVRDLTGTFWTFDECHSCEMSGVQCAGSPQALQNLQEGFIFRRRGAEQSLHECKRQFGWKYEPDWMLEALRITGIVRTAIPAHTKAFSSAVVCAPRDSKTAAVIKDLFIWKLGVMNLSGCWHLFPFSVGCVICSGPYSAQHGSGRVRKAEDGWLGHGVKMSRLPACWQLN